MVDRICHELLDRNKDIQNLGIIGIRTRGAFLAERITNKIRDLRKVRLPLGTLDITLYRDDVALSNRHPVVHRTDLIFDITDKDIILVDDVLFSGRTIRAALDELTDFGRPRTIQLAILIDRGHRQLPIQPDYVGKIIPTTLDQKVFVHLKEHDKKDEIIIGGSCVT